MELTHFDEAGRARMVDVSGKEATRREAVAAGEVRMRPETLAMIRDGRHAKGDVLAVAQIAGVMGAKRTADLVPMCHPLGLDAVELAFRLDEANSCVHITASARTTGRTGVEMEALTAVSVAALAVYDMCKAVDRGMTIAEVRLLRKSGGKSGAWERPE
ncbi:MAG: cyclic pyranopterin monophosphate synthase MoaC [Candidatus Sericytochromatia bacterium]|nr:cyclic pyranopterin monophosphate synthase MoaC [Candidatus Tanganyikabacteria bacterium]